MGRTGGVSKTQGGREKKGSSQGEHEGKGLARGAPARWRRRRRRRPSPGRGGRGPRRHGEPAPRRVMEEAAAAAPRAGCSQCTGAAGAEPWATAGGSVGVGGASRGFADGAPGRGPGRRRVGAEGRRLWRRSSVGVGVEGSRRPGSSACRLQPVCRGGGGAMEPQGKAHGRQGLPRRLRQGEWPWQGAEAGRRKGWGRASCVLAVQRRRWPARSGWEEQRSRCSSG